MLKTILELELKESLKNNDVTKITLFERPGDGFEVNVHLRYEFKPRLLITQRKQAKKWKSLDRFIKYANQNYSSIPDILLKLENHFEHQTN